MNPVFIVVPIITVTLAFASIIFAAGKQSKATESLQTLVRDGFAEISRRQDQYVIKLDEHVAADVLALSEINRSIGRLEGEVIRVARLP